MKRFAMMTLLVIVLISTWASAQTYPITVNVTQSPMLISLSAGGNTLVEVTEFTFGASTFNTVYSQRTEGTSLFLDVGSGMEIEIAQVNRGVRFYAQGAANVSVTMNDLGDHYYGVAEQVHDPGWALDLRGVTMNVGVMENYTEKEKWATAASACFMSTRGYGSLFDTNADGTYSFAVGGETTLQHQTGTLDWYIFYGPEGDKIHEGLFDIIGEPKHVPIWAMGPTIWKNEHVSGFTEVLNDAQEYCDYQIPVTHCFIDRPYSDGSNDWSQMNFKNPPFGNPGGNIATLENTYNMRLSTWISPNLWGDTSQVPNYLGSTAYIDVSTSASRSWYNNKLNTNQYQYGVCGHKIDRIDEGWVNDAWAQNSPPAAERRNAYLPLHSQTVYEGLYAAHGEDQFFFGRCAWQGSQQWMHAIWGGDSWCWWGGMRNNLANALNASYQGYPIWGADCGGYYGCYCVSAPTGYFDAEHEELAKRWFEWCTWNGFFEIKIGCRMPSDMAAKGLTSLIAVYREACEQRMSMLPYIYSLANTSDRTGVLMRPMTYDFPFDTSCVTATDQYTFGPAILVAPVCQSATSRNVYLPAGQDWVNFYDTTQSHSGGQTISAAAPHSSIPVFVKKNSIFPRGRIYGGNMEYWISNFDSTRYLDIHAYPGQPGTSDSFIYVDYLDNDTEKTLSLTTASDSTTIQFPAMTIGGTVYVRLDTQPANVLLNGSAASGVSWSNNVLSVPYPASQAITVTLNDGVPKPQFAPGAGSYNQSQVVTITCADPAATIYYTTNGTEPSDTNGTVIASGGTVSISSTTTLKARAYKSGETPSAVTSAEYVIDTQAPQVPGTPVMATVTDGSVAFSWAASSDNVATTGYRLFRNGASIGTLGATAYTDTTVTCCNTYSYAVAAYDAAANESAPSGSVVADTPPLAQDEDLNDDDTVDMGDLTVMAGNWLSTTCGDTGDINSDRNINLIDFASLAGMWGWVAPTNNLVLNPGFEDGMNNWGGPYVGTGALDTTTAHTATASFRADGAAAAYGYIDQSLTLTAGATYQILAWIRPQNAVSTDDPSDPGGWVRYVEITPNVDTHDTARIAGTGDWQEVSTIFTTAGDMTSGRIDVIWNIQSGTLHYDDVAIYDYVQ